MSDIMMNDPHAIAMAAEAQRLAASPAPLCTLLHEMPDGGLGSCRQPARFRGVCDTSSPEGFACMPCRCKSCVPVGAPSAEPAATLSEMSDQEAAIAALAFTIEHLADCGYTDEAVGAHARTLATLRASHALLVRYGEALRAAEAARDHLMTYEMGGYPSGVREALVSALRARDTILEGEMQRAALALAGGGAVESTTGGDPAGDNR